MYDPFLCCPFCVNLSWDQCPFHSPSFPSFYDSGHCCVCCILSYYCYYQLIFPIFSIVYIFPFSHFRFCIYPIVCYVSRSALLLCWYPGIYLLSTLFIFHVFVWRVLPCLQFSSCVDVTLSFFRIFSFVSSIFSLRLSSFS